jgi:hypothetical protein
MGERLGVYVRAASASASGTSSAASSSTAHATRSERMVSDDEIGKLAVNRSPPLSREANGTGGANFVVGLDFPLPLRR